MNGRESVFDVLYNHLHPVFFFCSKLFPIVFVLPKWESGEPPKFKTRQRFFCLSKSYYAIEFSVFIRRALDLYVRNVGIYTSIYVTSQSYCTMAFLEASKGRKCVSVLQTIFFPLPKSEKSFRGKCFCAVKEAKGRNVHNNGPHSCFLKKRQP